MEISRIQNENKVVVITVNLWKLVKDCSKKRWADCAVRNLKREVQRQFCSKLDVKLDMALNSVIWSRGKKNLPPKIRIEVGRRASLKDGSKTEFFVKHVIVPSFKGLQCESIIQQE